MKFLDEFAVELFFGRFVARQQVGNEFLGRFPLEVGDVFRVVASQGMALFGERHLGRLQAQLGDEVLFSGIRGQHPIHQLIQTQTAVHPKGVDGRRFLCQSGFGRLQGQPRRLKLRF